MSNAHKLALRATLGLALALTIGCSLPDEDGGGSGSSGSSSGGGDGKVNYGNPVTYESETYKTVIIGNQTWFAENLNYNASGSKCYDDDSSNCAKYGRLYDWETAKAACPSGWHLPSDEEWQALINFVDGTPSAAPGNSTTAGKKLKADSDLWDTNTGTDDHGFAALPGGYGYSDGNFYNAGNFGVWWSSSEYDASYAHYRYIYYYYENVGRYFNYKSDFYSIRCLQD